MVLGSGVLAGALEKRWVSAGVPVARAGRNFGRWHADLARGPDSWRLPERPRWVFVCAGVTSREACERDPWRSRWVNVVGGIRLARHFERRGARVVFFGTDLLPEAGEYARQKEDLRRAVASMPHCLWIRLGKVIHAGLPVFAQWRQQADLGRVKAWENVRIRPLGLEAWVEACVALVETKKLVMRRMDWDVAEPITYAELATRWARRNGLVGKIKFLASATTHQSGDWVSGKCPEPFRGLLDRESRKSWWHL